MTNRIRVGAMLVEDGTRTPESVTVRTELYSGGWSFIVESTAAQLAEELAGAGWTFFYMGGEIRKRGFGITEQSRAKRAVARVVDAVRRQNCNCLEITRIRRCSFWGLPYLDILADAKHIQKSRSFQEQSNAPASVGPSLGKWFYARTPQVRSESLLTGGAVHAWENEGGLQVEPTHLLSPTFPVSSS
jgi:hypothetical protein